jgi:uncharacterized protein YcbK (DUF882 family)
MTSRILMSCLASLFSLSAAPLKMTGSAETLHADHGPAGVMTVPKGATTYIVEPLTPAPMTLTLRNVNSEEVETFAIPVDGHADPATAAALKHFLRCRRTHREKAIAPGTLSLLVSVAQHWPGRTIDIVSGYRAPPYGKPHSKHFRGYAIDLRVEGVKTARLRDTVWRENHNVGVGHYTDEDFVHIDYRPGEGDMAWSSRKESAELNYNPRWARTARHPEQRHHSNSPRS